MNDQTNEPLALFGPIGIEDDKLRHALTVVPLARSDHVRKELTEKRVMGFALIAVIHTVVWHALVAGAGTLFGVLGLLTYYIIAEVVTTISWPFALASLGVVWGPPKKPGYYGPADWMIAFIMVVVGPVAVLPWYVDVIRRGWVDRDHVVSGEVSTLPAKEGEKASVQASLLKRRSSRIMEDDRSKLVVELADLLRKWERLRVLPNRKISAVNRGLRKPESLPEEYLERIRRAEKRIRVLIAWAEDLMNQEGPLGDENSCGVGKNDILQQAADLAGRVDSEVDSLLEEQARAMADQEIERLLTDEKPHLQLVDSAASTPASQDDS